MRIEQVNLYKFEDLSEDSKINAMEEWKENNSSVIFWESELLDSLKTLFKTANIELVDHSLGLERSYLETDLSEDVYNLSSARALGWLENNLFCNLRISRSEYLKNRKSYLKYGSDYRIGKIKPSALTGYSSDESFLEDLTESIQNGRTLGDAFNKLANKFESLLKANYKEQNSEEYIAEHISMNEYEFTEDGKWY